MKVSVSLITFNHAPFIRQAIESVLAQQTNFDFELVIGEDNSTDGTREIVQEYAAKFPGKIRLFLHGRETVIYVDGKPTGRFNLMNNIKSCRGQYVAMLDGDDYWTSPHKLQRQADLLDAHPEFAICFHNSEVLHQDGRKEPLSLGQKKNRYTIEDLLRSQCHMATASVMFRNRLFGEFPGWYSKVHLGDVPLHVMNAQYGDIAFIDEMMSVYRIHGGGMWSQGVEVGKWSKAEAKSSIRRAQGMCYLYEVLNEHLRFKYDDLIREKISMWSYSLVWLYRMEGDYDAMKEYLKKAMRAKLFNPQTPKPFVLKSILFAYLPFVYKPLALLKKNSQSNEAEAKGT